jgi:hypothetical protein
LTSTDEPIDFALSRGKRLKGLDEFEKPEFVGRIERIERRKKLEWWRRRLPWAGQSGGC